MEQKKEGRVIVKYQDKQEYIKNPMTMVERLGSFSLPAQKIMFEIISSIQPNINKYYSMCGKYGKEKVPDLFIDDDVDTSGNITYQIPLRTLCKHTADYEAIRTAAAALSTFIVKVEYEDKKDEGRIKEGYRQFMMVDVPKSGNGGRAAGYINVSICEEVAKCFFSLTSGGYAEHIKGIVNISKGKYTVALYTLLSKYFSQSEYNGECQMNYSDLRLNLKVDQDIYKPSEADPEVHIKVRDRKYVQYRDFKKRVLDTAKAELKKLWDENKGVDFWFDYDEVKVEGVRLSTNGPKAIRFIMHNERKVQAVEVKQKDTQEVVAARNKFSKFYNPCLERVGQEVIDMYYKLVKKAECCSNGAVVVYFEDGISRDAWKENIYIPCKEIWSSIFGNVEPVLKDMVR